MSVARDNVRVNGFGAFTRSAPPGGRRPQHIARFAVPSLVRDAGATQCAGAAATNRRAAEAGSCGQPFGARAAQSAHSRRKRASDVGLVDRLRLRLRDAQNNNPQPRSG